MNFVNVKFLKYLNNFERIKSYNFHMIFSLLNMNTIFISHANVSYNAHHSFPLLPFLEYILINNLYFNIN